VTEALYAKVYDTLRSRIVDGELAVGDRLPSQTELAGQFSVSVITVKRALDMLRDDGFVTRRPRIGTVVVSRTPEETVDGERLPLVGYLAPGFHDAFGSHVLLGLLAASRHHAHVTLAVTEGDADLEERLIEEQLARGIEGLILLPSSSQAIPPTVATLLGRRFPIVIVDRTLAGMPVSTVTSDNVAGGRMAAEYLFDRGHTGIALVLSPNEISSLEERRRGVIAAHAAHQVRLDPDRIFTDVRSVIPGSTVTAEQDVAELREFLASRPDITACVTAEYHSARLVLRAAQEIGRRVPEELSIVCFDAPPEFVDAALPFTHVEQDQHTIGRRAFDLLARQLGERGLVAQETVPVRIVEGGSTGPAPRQG